LGLFNEPVAFVTGELTVIGSEEKTIHDYPVLLIPTLGLSSLSGSSLMKARLEDYVQKGGSIICFTQQQGEDFGVLPGNLSGYGWSQDQSCFNNSVYFDTWHPILSGMSTATGSVSVDGFFTGLPEGTTVALSRVSNGMPAAIVYDYGNSKFQEPNSKQDPSSNGEMGGHVIVTTAYVPCESTGKGVVRGRGSAS
jgi:hypothetical protein